MPEETTLLDQLAQTLAPAVAQALGRGGPGMQVGFKHDAAGNPMTTGYMHGPGGLLTYPGVDQEIFSTMIGNMGIISQLPTRRTQYVNPTYFTLTGISGDTGEEKDDVCDDAPSIGLVKGCMITAPYGRYERQTHEIELNSLGRLVDRADPMDLRLVNTPIHQSGLFDSAPYDPSIPNNMIRSEIAREFLTLSLSLHRLLSVQFWRGNPANNTAGGGYMEVAGLELLINTGHKDAITGNACPSLDPLMLNFNYGSVMNNGNAIVNTMSYMWNYMNSIATRSGIQPVRWAFAMREELFWELTAVWPCAYLTYRCNLTGENDRLVVEANDQIDMRDAMRNGKYLLINGDRVQVLIDDGISEKNGNNSGGNFPAGCFASDIFLLPMSVTGGRSVLFIEYFDFTNEDLTNALGRDILGRVQGPWFTVPKQKNFCVQWQTKIEPRLVLRTPWLAARLQNVVYCPPLRAPQPFPDDPYFRSDGETQREGPSLYAHWKV